MYHLVSSINSHILLHEMVLLMGLAQTIDGHFRDQDEKHEFFSGNNLGFLVHLRVGKDANYGIKVKRIEADLKILKLQEEILVLFPDNEEKQHVRQRLLLPVDLIELCLTSQNRELSLRAFDVFAYTSSSFLKCNTSVLEECWRNAANQDDWERLYQTSIDEGWSDEETLQTIRETILFQASSRCYGPEAENYEGGFDEVLPLRQENLEPPTSKDMVSSVEAILMQHKDFAVAGKLMLTAIMLGSYQVDAGMEESPTPMG
ncbi:unnamed protein product [Ilex paraguariensis]|uniref:Uncharacterized protein n=1 Tax=Ilex paraguariensis TaxID=185542 RepID=A0ABC8UH99_9AQUA